MNSVIQIAWYLIHNETRQRIDGVPYAQAKAFIDSIPFAEHNQWFIWCQLYPEWINLAECSEFKINTFKTVVPPPPPRPKYAPQVPERAQENNHPAALVQNSERRKTTRFDISFQVVILFEKRTFRSKSKNISVGGVLLENKIPWTMVDEICEVFIKDELTDQSIRFAAKILSSKDDLCRISFDGSNSVANIRLQDWIEATLCRSSKVA